MKPKSKKPRSSGVGQPVPKAAELNEAFDKMKAKADGVSVWKEHPANAPTYFACEMDATQAGFLDVPLTGADHLRVRVGRYLLEMRVADGGLSVRATEGGVLVKGTCHNEVIIYPCDHNHRRTT